MADTSSDYAGLSRPGVGERWTARGKRRLVLLCLMSLILLPLQALCVHLPGRFWWPLAGLWYRLVLRIIGVKVRRIGQANRCGPTLFVSNHISWLDIMVLGAYLPHASFVAKAEIEGWGAIGKLCALGRTVFVDRTRRSDSARQASRLASRIAEGDSLILFPEGTSTDGVHVAPFKSALFSVAQRAAQGQDVPLKVQPVTLSFPAINGAPMTRQQRPLIAWIGDMELVSHLKAALNIPTLTAVIDFHPPLALEEGFSRKELARRAEEVITSGLAAAHRQSWADKAVT